MPAFTVTVAGEKAKFAMLTFTMAAELWDDETALEDVLDELDIEEGTELDAPELTELLEEATELIELMDEAELLAEEEMELRDELLEETELVDVPEED